MNSGLCQALIFILANLNLPFGNFYMHRKENQQSDTATF